jgi:hypothetical protein
MKEFRKNQDQSLGYKTPEEVYLSRWVEGFEWNRVDYSCSG